MRFHTSASLTHAGRTIIAPWVASRHGCDLNNVILLRIEPWTSEARRLAVENHIGVTGSGSTSTSKPCNPTAEEFTSTLKQDIGDYNHLVVQIMQQLASDSPATDLSTLYHLDLLLYINGKAFANSSTRVNTLIVSSSSAQPPQQHQQANLGEAMVRVPVACASFLW